MDITRPMSHPRKTTSLFHKVETRLKLKSNVEISVAGASNKPDDMNSPLSLVPLTNGTLEWYTLQLHAHSSCQN